ncbi:MAG: FAD-dependent oxidoreductase [Candidatus Pacebacteria bacterium]|nr:FAD-dependent oxidoreductase [Candidatus Paceibacterota bacterium]
MQTVRYIILGAGPAGLSVAHRLLDLGEKSFVVLEKEDEPGGLCRSQIVDGAPLDIGGGHFLDVKRQGVLDFLFRFLPRDEWLQYDRVSTIKIHGTQIDYPFEASLWQLPLDQQVDYLESIARAGCTRGETMPESFSDWIRWKLGDLIAETYMLPYNRKIWSIDLDRLGTYWLHKLPNVSFRETLISCLKRAPAGAMPAHAKFFYPKRGGYGDVWRRMGKQLGMKLHLGEAVKRIDLDTLTVNGAYRADKIITTIPWHEMLAGTAFPGHVRDLIQKLEYTSVEVGYYAKADPDHGDAHWTYDPDPYVPHHRVLNRYTFCPGARGYWTETNLKRAAKRGATAEWAHINTYAYPLNLMGKPEVVQALGKWGRENGFVSVGRWGEWEHMNSDVAVERGMAAADKLVS